MNDATNVPVRPARDLLHDVQTLLPGGNFPVDNPLVYANAGALGDVAFRHWLFWVNAAGEVTQPPVLLGRYSADCLIDGGGPYHVLCGDALVAEHLVLQGEALAASLALLCGRSAVEVARPCLMACHRGLWVWGHWLIDTLPRILLAERAWPGKFLFAVPDDITNPASSRFFVRQVRESLAAYGIDEARVLRLRSGVTYRFTSLFDVLDMRPPQGPHPGVLAALRALPSPPPFRGRQALTTSLRSGGETRAVANADALAPVLRAHRAAELDPSAAPFLEQVRAFRDSDVIVGDMGSNIAAVVYAEPGGGIVTLAPCGWQDAFFARIFARTAARHADVRGVSRAMRAEDIGAAPHDVRPSHLDEGVHAATTGYGNGPVEIDGRQVARAVGPIVLHIDFSARGNARRFQRSGFLPPEQSGTWGAGPVCELVIEDVPTTGADLWLDIEGVAFIASPSVPSRMMEISVNGAQLARLEVGGQTRAQILVSHTLLRHASELRVVIQLDACPPPKSLGISQDERTLGFMFQVVALRERGTKPRVN